MNDSEFEFSWHPLSIRSQQRLNWDAIYKYVEVHAHEKVTAECTPQRLAALKKNAQALLIVVAPEFNAEADRLRRERFLILGVAGALALAFVVLGCLLASPGYDVVKTLLSAGSASGMMTWSITLAFCRLDHESELRLLPKVFCSQFGMCHDCEAYERTFDQFSRATEALRIKGPDSEKLPKLTSAPK